MPTNEERREIVARLRRKEPSSFETVFDVFTEIGLAVNPKGGSFKTLPLQLADLIEPEPERKAKARPFPVEKDTGYFDTTKCECGYINDVSATYCGQCGCVIEVVHYAN